MSTLAINHIVEVSLAAQNRGLTSYNTSNLLLFTKEVAPLGADAFRVYYSAADVAKDFGTASTTYQLAFCVFAQTPNILSGGGYLVVAACADTEKVQDKLLELVPQIDFFGVILDRVLVDDDVKLVAGIIQGMSKMLFLPFSTAASLVTSTGIVALLKDQKADHVRCLFHTGAGGALEPLKFAAAYASRGLSVNFNGSLTTITMHLKDLVGVTPDKLTENQFLAANLAGADVFTPFAGIPKVFCSGANGFFDQVYNRLWFLGAIQIAGFNHIAQTSTKIPQTERGMDGLKSIFRTVCEQAVSNQYAAPGSWTSPDVFGNPDDFKKNISQRGYYIYSSPTFLQPRAEREARVTPLVQIALKEAGAMHSSSITININP